MQPPSVRCFGLAALALLSSCDAFLMSSRLHRFDVPAVIQREGLDDEAPDLLQLEISNGVLAWHQHRRQLAIPHGWEQAPVALRADGTLALVEPLSLVPYDGDTAGARELSLHRRRTERWPATARVERRLVRSEEQPAAARRIYRIEHAQAADGSVRAELLARVGDAPERYLGVIELAGDLAPAQCSTAVRIVAWPAAAAFDVALLATAVVFSPLSLPVVLLKQSHEPID